MNLNKFLKVLFYILVSLSLFYFFEVPFLIETAFAEEISSASDSEVEKSSIENKQEKPVEEPSLLKKVGVTLWDNRWTIFLGILVISSFVVVFYIAGYALNDVPETSQKLDLTRERIQVYANILNNPLLPPDPKLFIEDLPNLSTMSSQEIARLPDSYEVTKAFFSEAQRLNVTGVLLELPDSTILPFRVYPAMPNLLAEVGNPIFNTSNIQPPESPFLYANDPSMFYWISHAKETFPVLSDYSLNSMACTLQYHKVALVDPVSMTYTYYHQVDIVPINSEALSTPFETHLSERVIKSFLFKDNEAGWD